MKFGYKLIVLLLISTLSLSLASCATPPKEEAAVEVQPTEEELERQRQEEMERQRQEELERMRQEEMAEMAMVDEGEGARAEFDVSQLQNIYFDFDKYDIKDEYRDVLSQNAEYLRENPDVLIQIEGHCDERGTEEYNLGLGERRANAVKEYLISLGISEDRLYTISYGEEMPADPGHNEAAWAKNRRSEFKIAVVE